MSRYGHLAILYLCLCLHWSPQRPRISDRRERGCSRAGSSGWTTARPRGWLWPSSVCGVTRETYLPVRMRRSDHPSVGAFVCLPPGASTAKPPRRGLRGHHKGGSPSSSAPRPPPITRPPHRQPARAASALPPSPASPTQHTRTHGKGGRGTLRPDPTDFASRNSFLLFLDVENFLESKSWT